MPNQPTTRRGLIKGAAGSAAAMAAAASAQAALPPDPAACGVDHIVVLMQENRSFDHMMGWVPGARGAQAGRGFTDKAGTSVASHKLARFQNCSSADPNHSWGGGRIHVAGGAMDGFLLTEPAGDTFAAGYYEEEQVAFFSFAAKHWTICDGYHTGVLGPTFPNRFYMHAGQTDRKSNTRDKSTLPTIWDRAAAKGVSTGYYYQDLAFTSFWGDKYAHISKTFAQFKADAAAGALPAISFVEARAKGESAGSSTDDHPLADIRNGQVLMNEVYTTLSQAPTWKSTLFIIIYDEWGGFADHVVPPMGPVSAAEAAAGNVDIRHADGTAMAYLGIRTPCVLIGPRAHRGAVARGAFDPNAILNFMCWRFGLEPLGVRAATSGNIGSALNWAAPARTDLPPPIPRTVLAAFNPDGPSYGLACAVNPLVDNERVLQSFARHFADIDAIKQRMIEHGFQVA